MEIIVVYVVVTAVAAASVNIHGVHCYIKTALEGELNE